MTKTKLEAKSKQNMWTKAEKEESKEKYGCEIVIENGSLNEVRTTNAPTDSYIAHYIHDEKDHYDIVRGTRFKIYDMYYDKFKSGLKSIEYGSGNVKPNLWGYKTPSKTKSESSFKIWGKKIRQNFFACRVFTKVKPII